MIDVGAAVVVPPMDAKAGQGGDAGPSELAGDPDAGGARAPEDVGFIVDESIPSRPATIVVGAPYVSGGMTRNAVAQVARTRLGAIRACYQKGRRSRPALEGRITIMLVIEKDGRVRVAHKGASDLPDLDVINCVREVFSNATFPPSGDGKLVTTTIPIRVEMPDTSTEE